MGDTFQNPQVAVATLPHISNIDYQRLHKEYLSTQILGTSLFWGVAIIGALGWTIFNRAIYPSWINYAGLLLLLVLAGLSYIFDFALYRRAGYALREHDVIYREGWLWRKVTVVPFNRIQHAEVTEGPIDRLFGLSRLHIYTAGGSSSDLTVPGIRPDEGERMKYYILNKTSIDEEE
ncbi:MAG: PH domain-containing protein [Bacteroidota bacterium]